MLRRREKGRQEEEEEGGGEGGDEGAGQAGGEEGEGPKRGRTRGKRSGLEGERGQGQPSVRSPEVKQQQLEPDMEQWTGSKLGMSSSKVYIATLLI